MTLTIFTVALLATCRPALAQQETILHSFNPKGGDGINPSACLILDAAGDLYGTTVSGGTYGRGTAFELIPKAGGGWTEKVLHSFIPNGKDAVNPSAGLIFDSAGNLYGTAEGGGTYGHGAVFELIPRPRGGWAEKVLYSFFDSGIDGAVPAAGLILDSAGNLFGTTAFDTAFELTPTASGQWKETILHEFGIGTDGAEPYGGLVFDAAGNLYGTTFLGGAHNAGTVFELTPAPGGGWTETVLYSFSLNAFSGGAYPMAGLVRDAAGNLYGTTNNNSTVFELTLTAGGNWTETVLHSFSSNGIDGYAPMAGVIFDTAGNLYGTTTSGGLYLYGTVFELTPAAGGIWTETLLHDFGNGTDGSDPRAGLIFDAAGNLYGTTYNGGAYNGGTVFQIKP
ncbi:MAG TPA: choice-of-anchor tandem repeat GloVer-containing protein [Candidatus Acidoferrum sp.]|nr:choice-of-anchor tandem repeat GloVer-containing protein [Candidatus Acidoferrum sp.]